MVDSCQQPAMMGVLAAKWTVFRGTDRIECNGHRFEPDRGSRAERPGFTGFFAVAGWVSTSLFRVEMALVFERNGHRLESVVGTGYVPLTCSFAVAERFGGALFRSNSLKTH